MGEKLVSRSINKAVLAAGLGFFTLTSCSIGDSEDNGSWRVAITCQDNTNLDIVNAESPGLSAEADITVTCRDEAGTQNAPSDIQLLEGNGTAVTGDQEVTDVVEIDYLDAYGTTDLSFKIDQAGGVGVLTAHNVKKLTKIRTVEPESD